MKAAGSGACQRREESFDQQIKGQLSQRSCRGAHRLAAMLHMLAANERDGFHLSLYARALLFSPEVTPRDPNPVASQLWAGGLRLDLSQ